MKLAVLRDGASMTLPGIGLGLMMALALARLMSAMLFGVQPTDILTFASVAVLLLVVALLACYLPRAARLFRERGGSPPCSPPRLSATQLPLVTGFQTTPAGTFTLLIRCTYRATWGGERR